MEYFEKSLINIPSVTKPFPFDPVEREKDEMKRETSISPQLDKKKKRKFYCYKNTEKRASPPSKKSGGERKVVPIESIKQYALFVPLPCYRISPAF